MKFLLSLAYSALALVSLVLGQVVTRTDYPPGLLACYILGPTEREADVARAIYQFCDLWADAIMPKDSAVWFGYMITDCGRTDEMTQGGNYLTGDGLTYYLLSINPPPSTHPNGTYVPGNTPPDSKRLARLLIGDEATTDEPKIHNPEPA
ncbi:hypothetical protein LTR29_002386 [Friedmanniomyces endolithicus]|nr:hypothetical protein LTR29_002386 [Friedmanniomyces endolithicus]